MTQDLKQGMNSHWRIGSGLGAILILTGLGLSTGALAQSQPSATVPGPTAGSNSQAAPQEDGAIEEVVVTARKRSEKLIDTPVSVEAVSGADLNSSATTDLSGLSEEIPQLSIAIFPSGAGAALSIRGIGSPTVDAGVESTVSTVFDGVQLSRGLITSLGFFDVKSIQVLKGPQALFFGKNSPAGVVAVTSNDPTSQWGGYAREGYEFNAVEPYIEGAVSGPLTDTLKIRVAVKYDQSNGYLKNNAKAITIPNPFAPPDTATIALQGAPSGHWPKQETILGRMVLDWAPIDHFTAALHILGAHVHNDGSGPGIVGQCANGVTGLPLQFGVPDPTGSCKLGDDTSVYQSALYFDQPTPFKSSEKHFFTDFAGSLDSLELNYNLGPLTITAVTGYALYDNTFIDGIDSQFSLFGQANQQIYNQGSQEIRVSSHFDSPLNFVAGALYEKSRLTQTTATYTGVGLFPADPTTGRYDNVDTQVISKGTTLSPFAQAIWKIAPNVEFDAGARWTDEKKENTQYNTYLDFFTQFLVPGVLPPGDVLSGSTNFYNLSPEATLTWHPQPDTMVYAAFKSGYKSGGYSIPSVLSGTVTGSSRTTDANLLFQPEKSSGAEIGAKARLLEGKLQVTGAVYDYRYRGLQESIYNPTAVSFSVENAAAASTRGAESDIIWRVMPEVTLNASLTYNHGRFSSYTNSPCWTGESSPPGTTCSYAGGAESGVQNLSGKRLPNSSDWIEQIGFNWDRPLPMSKDYRIALGSTAHYLSNFNSSSTGNPGADFSPKVLLSSDLALYPESDRWRVELTGRNLLNEHYLISAIDRTGGSVYEGASDVSGPENRPREIWLQVTEHF